LISGHIKEILVVGFQPHNAIPNGSWNTILERTQEEESSIDTYWLQQNIKRILGGISKLTT